ncbi:gamma-butyrobetaine dioxygenase [Hydra vulgaris]|uniref:Gamma-butyrobetaine dioxygenase n=1 Tax=Hydra vulgaris TaxID=6087 RepID=T2MHI7_HYDVU|nr:gamma-butyrobetaine dioxygenase [Hydra vulgaris]
MLARSVRQIKFLFSDTNRSKTKVLTVSKSKYFLTKRKFYSSFKEHAKPLNYSIDEKQNIVEIHWDDKVTSRHSSIFLRDCCLCNKCFNSDSKQRRIDTYREIPLNIKPISIDITLSHVHFKWSDSHVTAFTHEFLLERRKNEYSDISHIKPTLWATLSDIPRYNLDTVLLNEETRYAWFQSLCEFGVVLFTGAKKEKGELERVKRIFGGYFKSTHYGHTFDVVYKPNPASLAYTSEKILPHVDLPHYCYPPGIQALHCIKQYSGEGGDTTFTDGFYIAQKLKQQNPESFLSLTKQNVTYRDIGTDIFGEFETFYQRPVIGTENGVVKAIDYSNWLRDYTINGSAEEIQKYYKAYYDFTALICDPNHICSYKLSEGEIVTFHNRRILHGRSAFLVNDSNASRVLNGCYFDWDQLFWSMRPIKRRLDRKNRIAER